MSLASRHSDAGCENSVTWRGKISSSTVGACTGVERKTVGAVEGDPSEAFSHGCARELERTSQCKNLKRDRIGGKIIRRAGAISRRASSKGYCACIPSRVQG